MGDTPLVYNHGSIHAGAGAIGSAIGRLTQQLADVEAGFRPIEQTWTGEALTSYLERREKWRNAANEIKRILGEVQQALTTSSDNMHSTDRKAATYFQR